MLGYFNRTHSLEDGTWSLFRMLLHFEVVLIIINIISIAFWFSVIMSAKNTHPNVRILNAFYYGQYMIQLSFWIVQPVLICSEQLNDADKFSNQLFTLSFTALPALVIERSVATFLLENYEKNPNVCIGFLTVLIQMLPQPPSTVVHTVSAIIANSLAVCLNKINQKINEKYFYESDRVTYSLSERFQITENIKAAKMFDKIVWSIGFFNIIVNSCLILDNYDIPTTFKNLASVSCDFSILLYGLIVPVVYYNQTDSWKKRVAVMLKGCFKPRVSPLKSTFGQDMAPHGAKEETTKYFEMLTDQWK
ncbi:Protein CBR-SRE-9 [Caenorhabditis briggsae]|uniref:Protein CBR-SRE-9 n=1 Tax=Caenorhabditis briggsae TaxID=6238 RepID=A8X2C7_CAEBR|nr:Protein CBR-SRE-9 [Caenorhabditis briggsae]CAP26787.2 Protein CBR-SRE-9 [Caenorhabditis briggsae]